MKIFSSLALSEQNTSLSLIDSPVEKICDHIYNIQNSPTENCGPIFKKELKCSASLFKQFVKALFSF
jgi:hypothetical protein